MTSRGWGLMKTGISVKWRAPCGRHAAVAAATATGYYMKIT